MATTVTYNYDGDRAGVSPAQQCIVLAPRYTPVSQSRTRLSEPDPVLEASRVADSTVPDGGYAWVVIGACADPYLVVL